MLNLLSKFAFWTMGEKLGFGIVDILVFSASLLGSLAIGIYYAYKDRQQESVENYFYASHKMSAIPVGLSISVTFISALTVIGLPTESYMFGLIVMWHCTTLVLPTIFACLYYIPLIHRLKLSTIYEYLEIRFHKRNRDFSSGVEILSLVLYMGTTVYVPALALSAVTPVSTNVAIITTSGICTVYTVCGGMKAVVWTDTLQTGIMLVGALAALIQGAIVVGGIENVWDALERSGRINFWDFDPDPRLRLTAFAFLVGASTLFANLACCSQPMAQRYLSCETVKDARIAAVVAIFPKIILTFIAVCCGATAYAYFEHCDPLTNGEISKSDQLLPYMVLKIFSNTPGMAGLFVAAAYSGTLSTVSSGINSLSAMILEDFVLPRRPKLSANSQMVISKVAGIGLGLLLTLISYLCSLTSGTILSLVLTVRGSTGGPVVGVFTLGLFFPWCNQWGAIIGHISGVLFTFWIAVGSLIYGRDPALDRKMPTQIDGCPISNVTFTDSLNANGTSWNTHAYNNSVWTTPEPSESAEYMDLYLISFMYYSTVGMLVTILVGMVVSFITGLNDTREIDPKVFVPLVDNQCFPESVRRFFRFGVPPLILKNDETKIDDVIYFDDEMKMDNIKETEVVGLKLLVNKDPEPL